MEELRDLQPGYFALVMATGILAIACQLEGLAALAKTLTIVAAVALVMLLAMTILRVALFPGAFLRDLGDYHRGVGFFTTVAGVAVLGSAAATVFGTYRLAFLLWVVAGALWAGFTYSIFAMFILSQNKPLLGYGIHGGWLLAVVATESVAQLGLVLLPTLERNHDYVLFLCLTMWLCGGMLYIWMISLIFYKYTFLEWSSADLTPSYWIDMGAMAIATVVGALLVQRVAGSRFADLEPFVKGLTILFWAIATWWFPMLAILSVWRHAIRPVAWRYDPLYWGAVFPLGMYAVATHFLAQAAGLSELLVIPKIVTILALAAWGAVATGMVASIVGRSG